MGGSKNVSRGKRGRYIGGRWGRGVRIGEKERVWTTEGDMTAGRKKGRRTKEFGSGV